ncbi:putative disease resistance protein RGA4 isoform X4 [Mangifera indica]|uniref:putative disease resistance protein RGA4 isoform X4 n=1 Tax=Mangifera indica TaxID=29780 RepID=UPI001CFB350E|nr:putative disease resistance protein RGA4 isoform X4 [Mangifera indica]
MEVVLEPVVSELVDGLFKILGSKEVRDFARKLVGGVDSEIKELESKLRMVEDLLRNAEDRQLMDKRVKEWLDNLQHWAYDAEDILDEFAYEALRHKREAEHQASSSKVFSLPASFSSPLFAFQMGSKIKKINSRLEKLRQQRSAEREFQKLPGLPPTNIAAPQKPEETSSVPLGQVYGRNEDEVELLKMVKSGANFQPIAVVGVGGIGKTTIAREVYNHKELEDIKFEKKAWVCVSTTFDVLTISKKLLQQFSSPVPDNLNDVQVKLKEAVSGKKFLIVLDDIWKVEYIEWEKLKSPLAAGALGSTMIVTTRHEHVAKEIRSSHTHRLSLLSDGDCKSLFQEHAFGTGAAANADQISISIYERVLKRCKGLPLAAKTLGCLLRSKPSDTWEKILDSKIWSTFNESDHILPALKLSYHYLPSNLKRCFGYCAIFPQDYEFEEKELALLWIAEGIVQPSNEQLDEAGLHHLPCLYRIGISGCPKLSVREGVPTSLRQLLINECEDDKGMGMGTGTGMLTSLKTLEIFSLPQLKSISDLTNVTALERLDIISLPLLESISDLTNLTSLKWLQINNLPQLELISNLSGLTSLTELYIDKCQKLKSIPSLSGLTSLEVLLIHNLPQLETFPSFSGLTSLERLNIAKLPQLESIPNLSGLTSLKDLQISECPRIKSIRSLSGLTSLQQLRIADLPQLESIQDLSSLTSLEDLQISECPRIKSIRSLSGLTSLQQLRIADLPQLESIQDLSSLTSLEDLQISECPRIKSIRSLSGLTSLQQLRIADLPQLESIQDLSNLTSLEDLQISKCPRIKSIPSLSSLTSLQSLRITDCPLLIKRWKSVTGKYSSKIAQIPKVEIDGKFIYNSKEYEVDDWSFFL